MVKAQRNGQAGFTLIEIIAVLVLLGVLAAVIVPRYNSMVADARNKAAMQAVSEGIARVNAEAAKSILNNNGTLPAAATLATAMEATATLKAAGDYTLVYAECTTCGTNPGITITATGVASTNAAGSTGTGNALLPQ
jgi:prepilin-type N-terminal cleavage/methylation domain-containing protein